MTTPPAESVADRIQHDALFFDSAIFSHGFTTFMRDYDVIIDVVGANPDGTGSYIKGRYRYRFTHCIEAIARTTLNPEGWQRSWDDLFTDYKAWEAAGEPAGYVWGVEWSDAYPGMSYVENFEPARRWTDLLGHVMHEVLIESNAYDLRLVFHDLRVEQVAVGDPESRTLTPLD